MVTVLTMLFTSEECEIYVGSGGLLSCVISSIWVKRKPAIKVKSLCELK